MLTFLKIILEVALGISKTIFYFQKFSLKEE